MQMRISSILTLPLLFGLVFVSGTAAAATYAYFGGNFDTASGTYTTAMRNTGQFSVAGTLPVNMPNTDISAQVTSYSFNDGVQTLTQANSKSLGFSVSTDGAGNISTWNITVWVTPVTTMALGQVAGIGVYFSGTITSDLGFTDGQCNENFGPGGECTGATVGAGMNSGSLFLNASSTPGSWNCNACTVAAVPTLGEYAQMLLMLLLAGAGFAAMRRSGA